jgi:hypothetical protein
LRENLNEVEMVKVIGASGVAERADMFFRNIAMEAVGKIKGVEQRGSGAFIQENACDFDISFNGKRYGFLVKELADV